MKLEEAIKQLKSLQEDIIEDEVEHDSIFMQDYEAIETVLQELEKLQKENEKLKEIDLTTVHIKGVCDEKERWRNKIKEKIKEVDSRECDDVFDLQAFMYEQEAIIEELEELLKGE